MHRGGSTTATARIKRDLKEIYDEKTPMIHVVPHESDIATVHALIEGPEDTPYDGGFFYFTVRFPSNYPSHPPAVRIQTTGSGRVRFNPNLYAEGKVCLSILHTWDGPKWTPALSLKSVLLSIQSLMNEEPWYNEPGHEKQHVQGQQMTKESKDYNEYIDYETIRIAVIGMLEDSRDAQAMPQALKDVMVQRFKANFKKYVARVGKLKMPSESGWGKDRVKKSDFSEPEKLRERLMKLKDKYEISDEVDEKDEKKEEPVASYEAVSSNYVEPPKQDAEKVDVSALIDDMNSFLPSDDEDSGHYDSGSSSGSESGGSGKN